MVLMDNGRPTLATDGGGLSRFTETLEWGYRLAETPCGIDKNSEGGLWNAKGWKEMVEHMAPEKQAYAALMLENCRKKFARMNESTRTSSLGTFDKWIFPMLANMAENDVIDQLVALQPMPGPVSQIVYMDIVTAQRKGATPAGSPMWRALAGAVDRYNDSDELVQSEPCGTSNGTGALSGTVDYSPVRAGNFSVTDAAGLTAQDDANGSLVGNFTGTIDYQTGSYTITGATANSAVTATYTYNSEGNLNIQGYEAKVSSSPVTARVYKLKTLWSEEADQNMEAMYNIKLESVLLNAITSALQYQKHRSVIADLRNRAGAGLVQWNGVPPTNVNYQTHKYSIVDAFTTGAMQIFSATNTMMGNRLILGVQAATVVMTLPQFNAKGNMSDMQGITYLGDLGNFKVFVDPHYPQNEWLNLYKGDQWLRTVYVLAEYQKLYTTPNIQLPDFINQRGFATSFAKRLINAKGIGRGIVNSAPVTYGP